MSQELDAEVAETVMGWLLSDKRAMGQGMELLYSKPDGYYQLVGPGYWSPSTDISTAWQVVEKLRDMWTAATEEVSGLDNSFPRPFDDGAFFDVLHRNADRRWPWAFLYVTPEAICKAALAALDQPPQEDV